MRHIIAEGSDQPDFQQLERWNRWLRPPDNEVPVAIPLSVVLGRSQDLAVIMIGMRVFSTGVAFDLGIRVRTPAPETSFHAILPYIVGSVPPEADPLARRLQLSVEFADGQRLGISSARPRPGDALNMAVLTAVAGGGSTGEGGLNQPFWMTQVPPDGPVTFITAWPGFGIAETRFEAAALALSTDREHVTTLWRRADVSI